MSRSRWLSRRIASISLGGSRNSIVLCSRTSTATSDRIQEHVLLKLGIHSFGPVMLTFSLGRNGGGPMLVGFYRFGTWILKSSPVLVRFASGPCDPSILGYLCHIPKLGHCRFECCLWWRCRRLTAFGRLIPRRLLLAWGLWELCVLDLCHLAWTQTVITQLRSSLSPSG